jgi:hypothetical protein
MYLSEMTTAFLVLVIFPLSIAGLLILRAILRKMQIPVKNIRWILVLVFLGVILGTVWQAIVGTLYLRNICEKDGGFLVYETAQTEGIYLPYAHRDSQIDRLLIAGFKYVETDSDNDEKLRYSLSDSQKIVIEKTPELESRYKLGFKTLFPIESNFAVDIGLNTNYVENIRSGTNLAEYRDYYVTGTWFDNYLRSGFPSGLLHCSDLYPGNSRFSIGGRREIESVLTPK